MRAVGRISVGQSLLGPSQVCCETDTNMLVWRAYTSRAYNDDCCGRLPCCYCCLQTSHQRFMLTFPGHPLPKMPLFSSCALSFVRESGIFPPEIEACGYSNAQLKEFIEKIYDCIKKYGSGCALVNGILMIPILGAYIENGWMQSAIHREVDAENSRLRGTPASFRWVVNFSGNGLSNNTQVQLNLTAKKGYGSMIDLEAEQTEIMKIYGELRETLGYHHPNCNIKYAKTIYKQRKGEANTLDPLVTSNLFPGQTASVAPSTTSIANEIEKLKNLRDEGVLSDAEFTAAKAKLIGA